VIAGPGEHEVGEETAARTGATAGDITALPGELDRPPKPLPRTRRASQVVEAARQVLEDEGREALTMRRVAEVLGIQAPSLYKHFANKSALEMALVEDALVDIGEVTHAAIHLVPAENGLVNLLGTYRRHSLAHPHLYRLATAGPLRREVLPPGLEEWAGNPWYVVTGDPYLAQALWSFAHGMVVLELDRRYPPGSDLDHTWRAGADAFARRAALKQAPGPG
jgi:AcrR family transcriptional regulator